MNDQEKEIIEKIKASSEDIPVPEGLMPEMIEDKLNRNKKKRPAGRKWIYGLASAAAFALVVFAAFRTIELPEAQKTEKNGAAVQEDSAGKDTSVKKSGAEEAVREMEGAEGYEEIYKVIKKNYQESSAVSGVQKETASEEDSTGSVSNKSHSKTNVQTSGVDEGDIVKNDGRYIYFLDMSDQRIHIMDGAGGKLRETARIEMKTADDYGIEMYLSKDRLVLISSYYEMQKGKGVLPVFESDGWSRQMLRITTYDISDRSKPKKSGEVTVSGNYGNSRLVGDYLYVFSNYIPMGKPAFRQEDTYVPVVGGKAMDAADIYLPGGKSGNSYTIAASVDLKDPGKTVESKAVLMSNSAYYVSENAVYMAAPTEENRLQKTELFKFTYKDGRLRAMGKKKINGRINNSFSMDEHKGYLRVVVTEEQYEWGRNEANTDVAKLSRRNTVNSLYILDKDMNITGSIRNLARGERIKSARFMGDTGYFVTFRDIDPLFSADLSDPKNPKILGELKVTGFSQYLHFYDDNLLLGIGVEVLPDENKSAGIKMSMFDISNPKKVKEADKVVFSDYQYAEALEDHHAVFIEPEKNLFGFALTSGFEDEDVFVLYRYDKNKGFQEVLKHKNMDGFNARGLYMGDTFYLVKNGGAVSYSMKDFKQISSLEFEP